MDTHSSSPGADAPDPGSGGARATFARVLDGMPRPRWKGPEISGRMLFLLLAILLVLLLGGAFLYGSFQTVDPGFAGVSLSRFTGALETLPPGAHFRPRALYEIHTVRISDQLMTGPEGTFSVSTREGVVAQMTVQARWSIDRSRLLSSWAALPRNPQRELVAPILAAAFRSTASRYDVGKLVGEGREEIAAISGRAARARLAESGVVLKDVLVGNVVLPAEYERGRVAFVDEVQSTDRMAVTLRLKEREIEKARLEAEARKVVVVKQAEAAASQRLIGARAESDAMKYILTLKEKEIEQKKLEARGDRQTRVERARSEAEVTRIQADAEVQRRKLIADAEAYSIRATSLAQFEGLQREAQLVSANPLLIPKTFADRLSDKVQVILTPSIGGEAFTGEVMRRVANGLPPVAPAPVSSEPTSQQAASRQTGRRPSTK
ncbi:MAG: SPFH domain-containing protein [Acidobacteriota bacterium]